ncbi:hypothetical protein M2302_000367 [Micromonospora sp. A200]|nr:hypothetical protein [Micromonospora sp. A200]
MQQTRSTARLRPPAETGVRDGPPWPDERATAWLDTEHVLIDDLRGLAVSSAGGLAGRMAVQPRPHLMICNRCCRPFLEADPAVDAFPARACSAGQANKFPQTRQQKPPAIGCHAAICRATGRTYNPAARGGGSPRRAVADRPASPGRGRCVRATSGGRSAGRRCCWRLACQRGALMARKIKESWNENGPGSAVTPLTRAGSCGAGDGNRTRTVSLEGRRTRPTRTWWARSRQEARDRSCPLVTVRGTGYWHVDGTETGEL